MPSVIWPALYNKLMNLFKATETIIQHQPGIRSALDGSSIRVLNWNIAKNNHLPQWQQDFRHITQRYAPNLMFLQEARLINQQPPIPHSQTGWHFAPNFQTPLQQAHFGVLTATETDALRWQSVLTEHFEPFFNIPKVALITEYALAGTDETLMGVNMHGINFVSTAKFEAQLYQLETAIAHHQGPIILSGDFNTWHFGRMDLLTEVATRLKLKPVEFADEHEQHRKRFFFSHPLDHIFYRELTVIPGSATVIPGLTSSDHAPMMVEFYKKT